MARALWALVLVGVASCSQPEAPKAPPATQAGQPATPAASGPQAPAVDALVPGTDFHATSTVPCSRKAEQPMAECKAGAVRNTDGSATVTVFWPGGGSRAIFFAPGQKVVGADTNQADGSAAFPVQNARAGDLNRITIGGERYEIPDALPYGG